jgi:hypothetical protein
MLSLRKSTTSVKPALIATKKIAKMREMNYYALLLLFQVKDLPVFSSRRHILHGIRCFLQKGPFLHLGQAKPSALLTYVVHIRQQQSSSCTAVLSAMIIHCLRGF